jgi:geranylgeranyl pyrophosphate synthase
MSLESQRKAVRAEITALVRGAGSDQAFQYMLRRWLFDRGKRSSEARHSPWPVLTLQVCETICGTWGHAVPAAAAIELFVAAGDLLDDIEDGDYDFILEHGYSVAQANNAAAALLMLGQRAVTNLLKKKVEPQTIISVMEAIASSALVSFSGQHAEFDRHGADVSEREYLRLVEMKSGTLTECACRVGALLATDDARIVDSYALFGRRLGVAAQLANDARSIISSPPGHSDIARKKRTLPIIYGLKQADGPEATFLESVITGPAEVTADTESEARQILMTLGAVHYTLVQAQMERQKLLEALESSGIPIEANTKFLAFLGLDEPHADGE